MIPTRPEPEPPARSARLAGRPVKLGFLLALAALLAACGRPPAPEVQSSAGAAGAFSSAEAGSAAAGSSDGPTLPTLPPAVVREPDRFDAKGCVRTGPEAVDCTQRGAVLDAATAGHGEQDWRSLAGFQGRFWTADTSTGRVLVLEPSVRTGGDGRWSGRGLARNENARPVAGITVVASLLGADGTVLETVSATSPVGPVRAGEPVPFELLASLTPASAVASVRWEAAEVAGAIPDGTRDLELTTYWTRGYGLDRPVDLYLHHDPPGGPAPYLLFGSVLDHGPSVAAPHVVVAWIDRDGGVLAVRDVPVADPSGAPAAGLGSGASLDFLAAVDDPVAGPHLDDAAPMLWGAGR